MTLAPETRRCALCRTEKAISEFARCPRSRGGRELRCRSCRNRTRRDRWQELRDYPNGVAATNVLVDLAPSPRPAIRLRAELERQRDRGRTFRKAWPVALSVALADLPLAEATSWRRIFTETRGAWASAYGRLPFPVASGPTFALDEERTAA